MENKKLRQQLKEGATARYQRDLDLAKEWFFLEDETFKLVNVERLNRIVAEKVKGKVFHKNLAGGGGMS